jgi:hypothetical protein
VLPKVLSAKGFYAHGYYNPACGTVGIQVSKPALLVRKKMAFRRGQWGTMRSTAVPVTSPKSLAERTARSMLAPERMLIPFLKTFWGEAYPADRKAQGRPISAAYTANCLGKIKNYIDTYTPFASLALDGLTVDALEKWRTWLSGAACRHGESISVFNA